MMKKFLVAMVALLICLSLAQAQNRSGSGAQAPAIRASQVDTRLFFPQVDRTMTYPASGPRLPKNPRPVLDLGLPAPFEGYTGTPGNIGNYEHPVVARKFPGISFSTYLVADPHLAVGNNHVVMVVNGRWAIFDKNTGSTVFEQSLDAFFSATNTFDPKVLYDRQSNRWVIIALTFSNPTSTIEFAISDDSDPNGIWKRYSINAVQTLDGASCGIDYPGFGYNKDAYVVSGDMFTIGSSSYSYKGVQWVIIPKSGVLSGNPLNPSRLLRETTPGTDLKAASFQVAETNSATESTIYSAGTTPRSDGFVQIYTLGNLTGTPTITSQLVDIPPYVAPLIRARSNTKTLDALDGRIINLYFRDNKLYFSHTINNVYPLICRWYELAVNSSGVASMSQTGDIGAGTDDAHMMSVAKSDDGRLGMVYSRSGPSTARAADIMFTSRLDTDPVGTVAVPTMLLSSNATFTEPMRWGDYCATAIDPSNGIAFWVVHLTIVPNDKWQTHFFKIDFAAALSNVSIAASTVEGGLSTTGTVTLNGEAPPGGRVVNLSDGGNVYIGVPASVTVQAGSRTADFTVTTSGTTTNQTATISATQGAVTRTATLTVIPIALPSTLSLNPTSVAGGNSSTATITLDRNAPAGGVSLTISDNSTLANAPATVKVSSGNNSATFMVNTSPTSTTVGATITVRRGAISRSQTLTIAPPKIADFQIAGASIQGGSSTTATVTLNGPAPANTTINITDNTVVTVVPTTATVTTGNTQVSFNITTIAVATNHVSTVLVSLNGVGKTDTLTVLPPVLNSITISVASIQGGLTTNGALNMSSPAPAAGLSVDCSSSNPGVVVVPATVLIGWNQTTQTFVIKTKAVSSTTSVTVSATFRSITRTRNLTVTP